MLVEIVNGSPHKNGSTSRALAEVERTLNEEGIETHLFWLGAKPISGCLGCSKCAELGRCVIDDKVNEFRALARKADGFIFGASVHYGDITGHMKAFMDRLFFSELLGGNNEAFRLKPVSGVTVARRSGTVSAFAQLNRYFTIQEMYVVSSRYWNNVFAMVESEVTEDKEGLCNMRTIARNMAYFLRCREAAQAAGVPLPKSEPRVYTNFTR
ncbi:MAG: flavodoxin family protein [Desulfovibrionaceae bacterium]|nr:flavodoxin family protein [Desulfovibrionaceae bacterium]